MHEIHIPFGKSRIIPQDKIILWTFSGCLAASKITAAPANELPINTTGVSIFAWSNTEIMSLCHAAKFNHECQAIICKKKRIYSPFHIFKCIRLKLCRTLATTPQVHHQCSIPSFHEFRSNETIRLPKFCHARDKN